MIVVCWLFLLVSLLTSSVDAGWRARKAQALREVSPKETDTEVESTSILEELDYVDYPPSNPQLNLQTHSLIRNIPRLEDSYYPWLSSIRAWSARTRHLCSGVLVGDHAVVTSAECIRRAESVPGGLPNGIFATVGTRDLQKKEPGELWMGVREIYISPDQRAAVLVLHRTFLPKGATPRPKASAICLPQETEYHDDKRLLLAGWNADNFVAGYSVVGKGQYKKGIVFESDESLPLCKEPRFLTGVFGSPLVCIAHEEGCSYTLCGVMEGVTSLCGQSDLSGAYDIAYSTTWIRRVLRQNGMIPWGPAGGRVSVPDPRGFIVSPLENNGVYWPRYGVSGDGYGRHPQKLTPIRSQSFGSGFVYPKLIQAGSDYWSPAGFRLQKTSNATQTVDSQPQTPNKQRPVNSKEEAVFTFIKKINEEKEESNTEINQNIKKKERKRLTTASPTVYTIDPKAVEDTLRKLKARAIATQERKAARREQAKLRWAARREENQKRALLAKAEREERRKNRTRRVDEQIQRAHELLLASVN